MPSSSRTGTQYERTLWFSSFHRRFACIALFKREHCAAGSPSAMSHRKFERAPSCLAGTADLPCMTSCCMLLPVAPRSLLHAASA